jgi:catechol 2,3-dioxygenase-like lactoylglutathione lyase family enzyme
MTTPESMTRAESMTTPESMTASESMTAPDSVARPGPAIRPAGLRRLSVCVSVSDLDAALAWYRDVLGFHCRVQAPFPDLRARAAFVETEDFRFELVQTEGATKVERPGPPWHTGVQGLTNLALYVEDLDDVLDRLSGWDVKLAMDPVNVDLLGIRSCFVRDPDGNLIELIEDVNDTEGVL